MYKLFIKRLFDFLIAASGLIIFSPIMVLLTLVLAIDFKGNPYFTQPRPGKGTKIFKVIKFKTMNDRKDPDGNLLPDSERLTPLGLFVRKNSLDEIPQLLNMLLGHMSLIGPRPLRTFYIGFYTPEENRRHDVRPGITGLAQVSGRNLIDWETRFKYDVEYVDNLSFALDLKIFIKTIYKVINRSDFVDSNDNIIPNFKIHREKQLEAGLLDESQLLR